MDYKVEPGTNQDLLASVHHTVWAVFILLSFWEVKKKKTKSKKQKNNKVI